MCYPSSLRVRDFYQSVKSNKIDYVSNIELFTSF